MNTSFRCLGIDPGSRFLGYAVGDIELTLCDGGPFTLSVIQMDSLSIDHHIRDMAQKWFYRTERQQRLKLCSDYVTSLISCYSPDMVVIEDAYLNPRQPTSYRSLSEGIIYLIEGIIDFDPTLPILTVEATKAKRAVGAVAKKNEDKKAVMRNTIETHPYIALPDDFYRKTEHAVDAVSLAYYGCAAWWEENRVYYS